MREMPFPRSCLVVAGQCLNRKRDQKYLFFSCLEANNQEVVKTRGSSGRRTLLIELAHAYHTGDGE